MFNNKMCSILDRQLPMIEYLYKEYPCVFYREAHL